MKKTHLKDQRMKVNAGMDFPTCKADAKMLDLDAAHLPMTDNVAEVTCKHCLKRHHEKWR